MRLELSDQELSAARYNWMLSGPVRQWAVKTFGVRLPSARATPLEILTIYVWMGNLYARREMIIPDVGEDPMPPFKPDYVEGGRRK